MGWPRPPLTYDEVNKVLVLLPEQAWLLHGCMSVSVLGSQSGFRGLVLAHVLVRYLVPPPHDTEHAEKFTQSLQVQFSASEQDENIEK